MFITIDGLSGAGKTTQAEAVAKELEFEAVSIDILRNMIEWNLQFRHPNFNYNNVSSIVANMSLIRCLIDCVETNFVIADNFWRLMWTIYREQGRLEAANLLGIFLRVLQVNGGELPVASFCLHVPPYQRHVRTFKRRLPPSVEVQDVDINVEKDTDENSFLEYITWLKESYDFIHIIDGTQPVETVTAEIVGITNDSIFH